MSKDKGAEPAAYERSDVFRVEDLLAALEQEGAIDQGEIERWRAEEERWRSEHAKRRHEGLRSLLLLEWA
jgi:hypothetical protein